MSAPEPTPETTTTVKPNNWHYEQLWRKFYAFEQGDGQRMRRALIDQAAYPLPNGQTLIQTANNRAALLDIIDELSPDDLAAVFNVARLLLPEPDAGDAGVYFGAHELRLRKEYNSEYFQ